MDTHYVMSLVRAYGRAVRLRHSRADIEDARERALMALGHAGVITNMSTFLDKYAEHSWRCGDRTIELEERGAAGGRAIEIIGHMEAAVRSALRETPPLRPRADVGGRRAWTMQIQFYDPVTGWTSIREPVNVAVAGTPAEVAAKIIKHRDLSDQHRVRLWHGEDADTSRRPVVVWPPTHR